MEADGAVGDHSRQMAQLIHDLCGSSDVVLRREALAVGVDDDALRRLVRAGVLVRIRQGAYARRDVWAQADSVARQGMLTDAVLRLYDDQVALSHTSAAIAYGASGWGLDLREVHLTGANDNGRRLARVAHHRAGLTVGDLTRWEGGWITTPTRTVLDVARIAPLEPTKVLADELAHRGLTSSDELAHGARTMTEWPGTISHHLLVWLVDAAHESVGESRAAYLFWAQGLPRAVPQYEVRRSDGTLAGRVDFAWPEHGVIVEFDGREKYLKYLRPGETVADAIMREKRREDEIRELTGWIVIRLTWADLAFPQRTAERIRAHLRGRRLPA